MFVMSFLYCVAWITYAVVVVAFMLSPQQGRRDGQPNPGEDEALHAMVTGPTQQSVRKAVEMVSV